MTIKYSINKSAFYAEIQSLGSDEGAYTGWGRFIKTTNQNLINFFNDYLAIEHEDLGNGSCFAVGAYSGEVYDYWAHNASKEILVRNFDTLIKEAISNTGMYKGFGNTF